MFFFTSFFVIPINWGAVELPINWDWMDVCKIYRPISARNLYYVYYIKIHFIQVSWYLALLRGTTLLIGAKLKEEKNMANRDGVLFSFIKLEKC